MNISPVVLFLVIGSFVLLVMHWFGSGANKRGPSCGFLVLVILVVAMILVALQGA